MKKHLLKFLLVIFVLSPIQNFYLEAYQEKAVTIINSTDIRAAIDIGSGATKLRIAKIDLEKNKTQEVLFSQSFTVGYQESLENSSNNTFDQKTMETGLEAIKKCKELALEHGALKVVGIATASFRLASNAQEFINKVFEETAVPIYIIDQDLEAKLAFNAAIEQMDIPKKNVVAWDIGGGSLQMITLSSPEKYLIYRGDYASIPFKNDIIKNIQEKDPKVFDSPNPMNEEEMNLARFKARKSAANVEEILFKRIQQKESHVIGVGSIFNYGILPLVKNNSTFSREQLFQAIKNLENMSDSELGSGDFVNVAVSNPILILGFMEMLDINKVHIIDVNNADGAFTYKEFWNGEKTQSDERLIKNESY